MLMLLEKAAEWYGPMVEVRVVVVEVDVELEVEVEVEVGVEVEVKVFRKHELCLFLL